MATAWGVQPAAARALRIEFKGRRALLRAQGQGAVAARRKRTAGALSRGRSDDTGDLL
jgi:hypothetical protein